MGLYVKGSKINKAKMRKDKFPLGPEHEEGSYVMVRGMTAAEAEQHEGYVKDLSDPAKTEEDRKNAGYNLLALCVVTDDGTAMFENAKDVKTNFDISTADFVGIMNKINKLSGLGEVREKN